jgi:uroporphyrinogen decarboxylase
MREPNFENLLAVLRNRKPDRPTLFEFIIASEVVLPVDELLPGDDPRSQLQNQIRAFHRNSYDCACLPPWVLWPDLKFNCQERTRDHSISLNEGGVIKSRADFEKYVWPDMDAVGYDLIEWAAQGLPAGMKFICCSMGGVLENLISLVGYEDLCYLVIDQPDLVTDICAAIGSRLLRYYERCLQFDCIGAAVVNDDWGFKTQTMLAPADMRRFIFPWHKRIVAAIHKAGRPTILHSCGQMIEVWDDIIDDIRLDAKHSFEDTIIPIEESYDRWGGRIAMVGGIDVDCLCRSTPHAIYRRSKAMLERAQTRGGYALGTGNSVTPYIPPANYRAMIRAALE